MNPTPTDAISTPLALCRATDEERRRAGIEVRRFAGPLSFVDAIEPIRVVHLTDLHVGRVTPMRVQEATVAITNELRPDVVVITGDFVCHSQAYLNDLSRLMDRIEAPKFGVLGNHDHWSGGQEVRIALRRGGIEVLDNVNTTVELGHRALQLVGLDDAYTGHAEQERAVRGLKPNVPTLGLSHIAEEADALWSRGVSLVLSGHTHAGQITVARLHEIALGKLVGHRYVHGLYGSRHTTGAVYVGAGIGAAVVPFRVGERGRREIAVFELGVRPGHFDEHHDEQRPHTGRPPSPEQKARRKAAVHRKRAARERKKEKA